MKRMHSSRIVVQALRAAGAPDTKLRLPSSRPALRSCTADLNAWKVKKRRSILKDKRNVSESKASACEQAVAAHIPGKTHFDECSSELGVATGNLVMSSSGIDTHLHLPMNLCAGAEETNRNNLSKSNHGIDSFTDISEDHTGVSLDSRFISQAETTGDFAGINEAANEMRDLQKYPRLEVLITYSRKRRKNSSVPASTSPSIIIDAEKAETTSKVGSTLNARTGDLVEVNEAPNEMRDLQNYPRLKVLITYSRKRRKNSRTSPSINTDAGINPPVERVFSARSSRKLLVLDVNGLLADIVPFGQVPSNLKGDNIIVSGKAVFKRPFHDDFLQFCFERFDVGVWSSRIKRNMELVLDYLFGNAKHKLLFCWDQSHCIDTGYFDVGKSRNKPIFLKKLEKLWDKYEPDLPWERGAYDESNTLLLDDSPHKALCNPPNTAIFPNSYCYMDEKDDSLGPGGKLRVYLEGLSMAENVQKYIECNPFGQRPITEKNPSWRFYRRVIEAATYL